MIGGGGERKTLRITAEYADASNIIGDAATVAHKVDVLHRHCAEVGRDPADVEMTALAMVPDDADKDTILREADALAKAGARAIVVRSTGSEPSRWLEETCAPLMPDLLAIGG